jgi:hypothetical protein
VIAAHGGSGERERRHGRRESRREISHRLRCGGEEGTAAWGRRGHTAVERAGPLFGGSAFPAVAVCGGALRKKRIRCVRHRFLFRFETTIQYNLGGGGRSTKPLWKETTLDGGRGEERKVIPQQKALLFSMFFCVFSLFLVLFYTETRKMVLARKIKTKGGCMIQRVCAGWIVVAVKVQRTERKKIRK